MLSSEAQDGCGLTKSNKVAIRAFIIYYLALLTVFQNQLYLDISPYIDRGQSRFKDPHTCVPVAQLPWRRHLTDHGIQSPSWRSVHVCGRWGERVGGRQRARGSRALAVAAYMHARTLRVCAFRIQISVCVESNCTCTYTDRRKSSISTPEP